VELQVQRTKRERVPVKVSLRNNERHVREQLAGKVSGSHLGLWLLIPEYLRLGVWDLLQGVFGGHPNPMAAHLGLQMVNEAAVCLGRLRRKDSLCHQGFSLAGGLSVLATDESIHYLLDGQTMTDYEPLQQGLLQLRGLDNHYTDSASVLVLDPHRMGSSTKRMMPHKKKSPGRPSKKMMQGFFCNDIYSGQPLGFTLSASGKTCSQATVQLLKLIEGAGIQNALIVADKEHFTRQITEYFSQHPGLDVLMPAPSTRNRTSWLAGLTYQRKWAGYAIAESTFSWEGSPEPFRIIAQREGEIAGDYQYKAFLTTSSEDALSLLCKIYSERWSIEEFFNFEGDMGWNRPSTFNLNIRYGKGSLALMAQAAAYKLRQKLPGPYRNWTAASLANKALTNMEGDVRVCGDTIIVTYYRDHEPLHLKEAYTNISTQLENEGISPKIPWLMDYKLEFRFK
jgi:hypothetical protein